MSRCRLTDARFGAARAAPVDDNPKAVAQGSRHASFAYPMAVHGTASEISRAPCYNVWPRTFLTIPSDLI